MSNELLQACARRATEFAMAANPELVLSENRVKEAVNSAYTSTCLELANRGVRNLDVEVIVSSIPANTTTLTTTSSPAIPDMIAPTRIWERLAGTNIWQEMRQAIDHLPVNAVAGTSMIFWEFRDQALRTVGSTGIEDLKIHYTPRTAELSMPRDTFAYPDLLNPVALRAASRILGGNPFYESCADSDLFNLLSIDAHLKQSTPIRLRRRRSGLRRF